MVNRRIFWTVLVFAVLMSSLSAQGRKRFGIRDGKKLSELELLVTQVPLNNPDSVALDILTSIPVNELIFVKDGDNFAANMEISIYAMDEDKSVTNSVILVQKVVLESFNATKNRDNMHLTRAQLIVTPGEYNIVVQLVDKENNKRFNNQLEVEIKSVDKEKLSLSGITLVDHWNISLEGKLEIVPIFDNRMNEERDSIQIHFSVWNPDGIAHDASIELALWTAEDEELLANTWTKLLSPGYNPYVLGLPTADLEKRPQKLNLTVSADDDEVVRSMKIRISVKGLPLFIDDIDMAIRQARYALSIKTVRTMLASADGEKEVLFKESWADLDPTPETIENELLNEYYRRVEFANRRYRSHLPGWESDMGMVYIIYGQPDNIEVHPYDSSHKAYQVWRYYNKSWRFVFVDVNQFGDYRLVSPLYPTRTNR